MTIDDAINLYGASKRASDGEGWFVAEFKKTKADQKAGLTAFLNDLVAANTAEINGLTAKRDAREAQLTQENSDITTIISQL